MPFLAEKKLALPNKDLLSWMFDEPKYEVDKPIYIDALDHSRSISARQARLIVRRLIAGLRAAGLQPGDCVCVHSFNDIQYSMLFLGIIGAGGIFAGTNPSYTQFELSHHIKTSHTKFIITEPEMLDSVLAAGKECSISPDRIWIFNVLGQDIPKGFRSWEELMWKGEWEWVRFDDEGICGRTTAARLYSSGTTGLPKAATLTHRNLIAQHMLCHEVVEKPYEVMRLLCLPMFHASLVPVAHTTPLRSGHISYVLRRFELEAFLASVERFQISEMSLVPPLVIALIMSPLTQKYSLKSVRAVVCGAAPLGKDAQMRLRKGYLRPDAVFNQVWGMTETSCVATLFEYPESDDTGSIGRPIPNLDMKIIDEAGTDISAYDTPGEICVRGPTVIPGYFENPAANADTFDRDGYLKTGDIAYCDAKTKKWYIIDRKKELIKVRGFQVAPPELESVLLAHPQIVDAAVIGVSISSERKGDEEKEEKPRAYVVRRPGEAGAKVSEEEVGEWCATRLAKYKALTGGVVFVDAIPKNASGKILKRMLRDRAKEELKSEKERARL